ncbi:D-alanyl-D-alanine carboxypeptidase family protein [Sporosalibacterium faouarense]|uniref:D-alanyl-D-alanine carboxypeptidase family protein n=1 Tax=Sporosalibacterium faouarense TaxID=516123 RepID=UPI001FAFAEE9|nr:D-alanyl-D-alanine carboxypeptidase family protein [Sporosalibacterium faouarense]
MKVNKKLFIFVLCFMLVSIVEFSIASEYNAPPVNGKSGILLESESGRILYSNNEHQRLPIASTTKIMTALLALEHGNLDEKVKVDKKSIGIEGSSIYLGYDEEISLKDLVYGLMLRSGNDSAVAIAIHVGGSVENFIEMMNEKAKEIGANNTNFTNPHGLHNDNHYSTAYDLALITREAMKNDEFKKICKTKLWVAERDINKYFYNKNKTLWQYEGGDGVKIGYTTKAGRCLVSSATKNGMQLISVVLDDYSWFNDCYKLFDYGFENYKPMVFYDKEQFIKNINVPNGKIEKLPVITENSLVLPLTEDELDEVKIIIDLPDNIKAPIKKGTAIGKIKVFKDGELMTSENLLAKKNIYEKGFWDKAVKFFKEKKLKK